MTQETNLGYLFSLITRLHAYTREMIDNNGFIWVNFQAESVLN